MSLPNYLAKIKSAGIYRFVWDKSVVPPQQAETLRLLVGYSEKGPFNTPVYIETVSDFRAIFGNISKRLERKGVYFHRMAEQALASGPILALNLKSFDAKQLDNAGKPTTTADPVKTNYTIFDFSNLEGVGFTSDYEVAKLYNSSRFWKLDENELPTKLTSSTAEYCHVVATDTKENSCSIFVRKNTPESYSGITFRHWYALQGVEYPEYMEPMLDEQMTDYFADVYVFKGQFTPDLCKTGGVLQDYFDVNGTGTGATITLKDKYPNKLGQEVDTLDALAADSNSNFVGVYTGCTLPYFKDANGNYISLDIKFNADHAKHKMMMKLNDLALDDATTLTALKTLLYVPDKEEGDYKVYTQPTYIQGYTYNINAISGATIWEKCKALLNGATNPGLVEALTNRVDVEYHYIIDTFDSEITENKVELFELAKAKDNAFAIANFPKMSKFADVEAVKTSFAMPGDANGASYGAYYTQLTFSDGVVKSVIPSAALVSNLFMTKWTTRQPYYIVAGPNFSTLNYSGLIGPDYNFSRKDLDILEPMGINAIIYVPRLGTYISSNQTAKQIPVSGLSKVHIRELVIYLQNEIEYLLQSYQWELNTQPLRDTIKAKADAICDTIKNNGGIYEFVNICDETNNTPEVIDNEMIILDTEIEPARGAGKMVHQLTIHKTGGLTSSIK